MLERQAQGAFELELAPVPGTALLEFADLGQAFLQLLGQPIGSRLQVESFLDPDLTNQRQPLLLTCLLDGGAYDPTTPSRSPPAQGAISASARPLLLPVGAAY